MSPHKIGHRPYVDDAFLFLTCKLVGTDILLAGYEACGLMCMTKQRTSVKTDVATGKT